MPGTLIERTWTFDPTINAPPKYRRACRYRAFMPSRLSTLSFTLDGTIAGLVSDAEHAIRDLDESGAQGLAAMARLLLRSESIASSKIEGMQLDVRELARAEARLETGGRASATAIEVLASVDAMSLAVDEAALVPKFGEAEIRAIHRTLMERAVNRHVAGHVRTEQNWIGGNDYNPCGADFVPPPPEAVPELLRDLCEAIDDDRLPPVIQAALVHAQFETIHPFHDGNGRTGRALIHVVLRRRGLATRFVPPVSVALAVSRDRYIAGLTSFREAGVAGWIEFFASAAARAARLAEAYVAALGELRQRWREQLASLPTPPRRDAAAWLLIDILPAHPTISAGVAAEGIRRSKPQVYQAMDQLGAAGILVPLSGSKRNRVWEPVGLLDLIAQLESGELPPRGG